MTRAELLDLATLKLESGAHIDRANGMCLLEAVAYQAGEPHTDRPQCAAGVLANYGRALNDALPDDIRQQLVPFVPRLIGTAHHPDGTALDQRAGLMAADWLIRTYTTAWLRLAKLTDDADALTALPEITSWDVLESVTPRVRESQDRAYAARDAAWDAAWAAARDAAGAAAGDAAWDAARDAAGAAAGDAAWYAAWAAAWAAAGDALAPTVTELQLSAIALYDRMVGLYE